MVGKGLDITDGSFYSLRTAILRDFFEFYGQVGGYASRSVKRVQGRRKIQGFKDAGMETSDMRGCC